MGPRRILSLDDFAKLCLLPSHDTVCFPSSSHQPSSTLQASPAANRIQHSPHCGPFCFPTTLQPSSAPFATPAYKGILIFEAIMCFYVSQMTFFMTNMFNFTEFLCVG